MTCILCAIANGTEEAEIIFEDDDCLAITPLRPMTPAHVLLFPREHATDLPSYLDSSPEGAGRLMRRAAQTARTLGFESRGYRLAWNFGPDTNQKITHPHLHLLGGRSLSDQLG
ncbi:HIT domain-containing protein [Brevibacterium casei]|nr:HIT domain-containing protein [Brevibacterium casei]